MIHLPSFVFCLAGFAALALAVHRQQREILGRSLRPTATFMLRTSAVSALLLALGLLVTSAGWGLGLVMFSGHTTLAAGMVYCGLLSYVRTHPRPIRRG